MITIVDYGIGNVGSILNMLRRIGAPARLAAGEGDIRSAGKLILPGVGAFDPGMRQLHESGLVDALRTRVLGDGVPVLGICLGMQLLTRGSSEGSLPGLGWVAGSTVRFNPPAEGERLKVPRMGWNRAEPAAGSVLFRGLEAEPRFYFVHSYHVEVDDPAQVAAVTRYGVAFPSAVECGHVMGVQFHPEKSHRYGMALLRNFAERA